MLTRPGAQGLQSGCEVVAERALPGAQGRQAVASPLGCARAVPPGQAVQAAEAPPRPPQLPAGQQMVLPGTLLPAEPQGVQVMARVLSTSPPTVPVDVPRELVSAGQVLQTALPAALAVPFAVPGGQKEQSVAPGAAEYVPGPQAPQDAAPSPSVVTGGRLALPVQPVVLPMGHRRQGSSAEPAL